jgi:beta-glucosidase
VAAGSGRRRKGRASQNRLIETVAAANPNTVVVLHNGSPVEMPWISRVKGVLEAYLSGQASGRATVRILFGDANPSGRLPETFPYKLEDNPSYPFFGGDDMRTEYREGVFVGYRYYDKKKMDVLFPFGHGLSYTTFTYENLALSKNEMNDTDTLIVTVDVTNSGERYGKEVVQLYVADVESTAIRPVRELKGFEKVALAPGETRTVSFELDKRAFAYYETRLHDWHVESGEFLIQIGRSSREVVCEATVTVCSTKEIPVEFDENSILMDVLSNEKGQRLERDDLKDVLHAMRAFSEHDDETEAASEAITQEMENAMLDYMPLRAVFSFSPGKVTKERLDEVIKELNR